MMWELIRRNQRKSAALFLLMGLVLLGLGYTIGSAYAGPSGGGTAGVLLALIIWLILAAVAYFNGDSIFLASVGATEVKPEIHPRLFNVVEEMKIAAGLPKMPKVYVIDSAALNAFATGRNPETASVAVTAGLLEKLNRDELQGVVAHEVAHVLNRDILFMTFAGVMLGAIVMISHIMLRGARHGGGRYRSSSSRGGGQGQAVIVILALVLAILAPLMARLLYLAISRRREYLADATAARLTRYPEGLASALEKIANSTEDLPRVNPAVAPLFIANPIKQKGSKLADLTSTHPPISERIRILRTMVSGAGLLDYQQAFGKVHGGKAALFDSTSLQREERIPVRSSHIPEVEEKKDKHIDVATYVEQSMAFSSLPVLAV